MILSNRQSPTTNHQLIIHTDGGSRGNPGPAATGIVILSEDGKPIHEFGRYLGETTNNVAEYSAVLDALNWLITSHLPNFSTSQLSFLLDSKLVVEQLSRRWKIKEAHLFELASTIWSCIIEHQLQVTFDYVPRAENWMADRQVNLTLDSVLKTS